MARLRPANEINERRDFNADSLKIKYASVFHLFDVSFCEFFSPLPRCNSFDCFHRSTSIFFVDYKEYRDVSFRRRRFDCGNAVLVPDNNSRSFENAIAF